MTKQECNERAAAARSAAKAASERAALYAATFGGGDAITVAEFKAADAATAAAAAWERVAEWHSKTRCKALRDGAFPASMFGY